MELWLPKNKMIDLKVEFKGKSASIRLDTSENGITCVTTMKLR